jgi:hypothetical protein
MLFTLFYSYQHTDLIWEISKSLDGCFYGVLTSVISLLFIGPLLSSFLLIALPLSGFPARSIPVGTPTFRTSQRLNFSASSTPHMTTSVTLEDARC